MLAIQSVLTVLRKEKKILLLLLTTIPLTACSAGTTQKFLFGFNTEIELKITTATSDNSSKLVS
jgi:hypothetical protein